MKIKTLLIGAMLLFIMTYVAHSQSISANMKYAVFYSPEVGPYIETYLLINGNTVTYRPNENGKLQGAVHLSIIFRQGDTVVNFSKIELKSPELDTMKSGNVYDFMDCQRFLLPNGAYDMHISIADAQRPQQEFTYKERINVDYQSHQAYVSGIELLESYQKSDDEASVMTKNGYRLQPKISAFYPENAHRLSFYCEFYNVHTQVKTDSSFIVFYHIRSFETKQVLPNFSGFKRMTAKPVNVLIHNIDIDGLASGNYELVVNLVDRNNQLLASNLLFFQRSNPYIQFDPATLNKLQIDNSFVSQYRSLDSMRLFVSYLYPIATDMEKQFIFSQAKKSDLETLQRFFLYFWNSRNAQQPHNAWYDYKKMVDIVNHEYRAVGIPGYQTDRGRVYLRYGPPNTIVDRDFDAGSSGLGINRDNSTAVDGGTVPYQIWHYYQLPDNQRNKRFVFANPHLATNSYDLIHSDANGELYNPQWQSELQRQIFRSTTIDANGKFQGESGDYYNVPY